MKEYNILVSATVAILLIIFAGANLFLAGIDKPEGREYRVQIERAANEIAKKGSGGVQLADYPAIIKIEKAESPDDVAFLTGGNDDYIIREINGVLYRFDYQQTDKGYKNQILLCVNICLGIMAFILICTLLFIRARLLRPFHSLREMPYELSKGNLNIPLKEEKSRYFGKFIWGMDLLRERLEQEKSEELRLQKEKKTLILSITHDIKTPLSAIKLYAKALSKNLYEGRERQIEIAESINARADDVEAFLTEIIKASNEDFLNLQVKSGEFYLSGMMNSIAAYYSDKLGYLKIGFGISPYTDCLLKGDEERAVEVLQNIIENAVKYGSGSPIEIAFADEEDCRLLSVSNGACSITDNELPHIFDSFWRGTNAENAGGSGLGLYICRQLMHKMDGQIFAEKAGDKMTVTAVFRKA